MSYKKTLESKMKIRFHDCDPFNHLNNSKYLDYIFTARCDQLIEYYDLDIYKLAQEKGIGWVSAQTQISYFIPAYIMEEVTIQTQLINYSEKSLVFEASMLGENKRELKAFMWSKLVHFDLQTKKSHFHSEELMKLFKEVVNPEPFQSDFESRVKSLKNSK